MAQKVLYEIEVQADIKDLNKLEIELDNLKNSKKALLKIQKEEGSLNKQQRENLTKLNLEISKTSAKMQGVKTDIKNTTKANKDLGQSYNNLTAQNAILSKRLRDIQDPLGKNKVLFDKTALAIKNNTDKLTKMDASMGRHQRNVGNYGQAFSSLTPLMGSFGSQISMLQGTFGSLTSALGNADKAQKTTAISSRTLAISMMAIPVVLIAAALVGLVAAFSSTQKGADELNKIMFPVKAIFDALLGVVQEMSFGAFDRLKEAINNPKQAFIDLGKAIVDNVLNRFKAFGVFIEAIVLAMQGEFKASMLKGADAVIMFGTGVANGTDKLQNYGNQLSEVAKRAAEVGAKILALQIKFEEMEIATTVPLANMRLEFQKLKEIANDQLLTEIERIDALEKAMNVQRNIAKIEGDLLQMRIDKMILEQSLNDTDRKGKLELQKLLEEQLQFEEHAQKKIAGLRALQSGLEKKWYKDRADAIKWDKLQQEKYAKWLIENAERETQAKKDELEKQIKDRKDATKQSQELLDAFLKEEIQKETDAYNKRKETEKVIRDKSLEIAQQTSDAIFAIKQANLNRQMKNDLDTLQNQSDMENDILKSKLESGLINQEEYENNRIALAQKAEEERYKLQKAAFEKKKKLDTAQAIINGALAITSILATSPDILKPIGPVFLAQVGSAIASTAIQVGTIQSQQFAKGGLLDGNSHANGGIPMLVDGKRPIEAEGGEAIINKRSVQMFGKELDYINRAGGGVGLFEKGGYIRKYANGGLIQNTGISMQDLKQQSDIFASAINNLKVINVASETIGTYDNAKRIENEFTF